MRPIESVGELLALLADERPGHGVTALAHSTQCTWLLAQERPDDFELQVAGLVHDVASSLAIAFTPHTASVIRPIDRFSVRGFSRSPTPPNHGVRRTGLTSG